MLTLDGNRQIANFQNLKAQCAFKLAELVEAHRIAARPAGDQDEIMEDLAQIKQKDMDEDGRLEIEGKDEVREALGRSLSRTTSNCSRPDLPAILALSSTWDIS